MANADANDGLYLVFSRNMFGGHNNNPVLPVFLEENRFQYENNALPRLQLFGDCKFSLELIVDLWVYFPLIAVKRK